MYRLGIIEESIDNKNVLCSLASYFVSQRIENVPEDEYPVWHINEYQVAEHGTVMPLVKINCLLC